jgi:hypothetical protein
MIEIAFQAPRQYLSVVVVIFTWVFCWFFSRRREAEGK